MSDKSRLVTPACVAIWLALIVALAFGPVVFLGFTNYDDPSYVTASPAVRAGLGWTSLGWAFTDCHTGNWHPLTFLTHMADCQFYGLNPAGHHLSNLMLHVGNTVALFVLLRNLTDKIFRSAVVAALFGLHPLHVESVAWISERKDVLCTLFGWLSLICYDRYSKWRPERRGVAQSEGAPNPGEAGGGQSPGSWRWAYGGAWLFLALGLMSKPMLVTWPFVMLLLDFWPLRRFNLKSRPGLASPWPLVREKLPFFALSFVSSVITFRAQRAGLAVAPLDQIPLGARLANVAWAYAAYLGKLIWPTKLSVIYPYVLNHAPGQIEGAWMILLAVTAVAAWLRLARPYLLVGWAWYLGTLVPVIGLVQMGNQSMADRYSYIPSVGVFIIVVWGVAELTSGRALVRLAVVVVAALALVACAMVSARQISYWQDSETLFRHALSVTEGNYVAQNSLGYFYADQRNYKEAERCFHEALVINPCSEWAWEKLGSLLIDQHRYDEAVSAARSAVTQNPLLAQAHLTLGLALMKQGGTNEALAEYEAALRLSPAEATAHYNLANALAQQGRLREAQGHYEAALRTDPASADAHNNLAYILARQGNTETALKEFRAAIALRAELWPAHYGAAEILLRRQDFAGAEAELEIVLRLQPQFAAARMALGQVLRRQGKGAEAIRQYREMLRQNPDAWEPLVELGWILSTHPDASMRNGPEAAALAEHACQIAPQQPRAWLALGAARANFGQWAAASEAASTARRLAEADQRPDLAAKADKLLETFRQSKAYLESAGP